MNYKKNNLLQPLQSRYASTPRKETSMKEQEKNLKNSHQATEMGRISDETSYPNLGVWWAHKNRKEETGTESLTR